MYCELTNPVMECLPDLDFITGTVATIFLDLKKSRANVGVVSQVRSTSTLERECVCVCVRERDSEGERERERERESEEGGREKINKKN